SRGADVNVRQADGQTPLHSAVQWGHILVMDTLIVARADIEARDNDGHTPLHLAMEYARAAAADRLIAAGADINLQDKQGLTAQEVRTDATAWQRATSDGEVADQRGDYVAAETNFATALGIAEHFGDHAFQLAASLNSLAQVYMEQGRYAKAEQTFKRS